MLIRSENRPPQTPNPCSISWRNRISVTSERIISPFSLSRNPKLSIWSCKEGPPRTFFYGTRKGSATFSSLSNRASKSISSNCRPCWIQASSALDHRSVCGSTSADKARVVAAEPPCEESSLIDFQGALASR